MRALPRLAAIALLLLIAMPAMAVKLVDVEVQGLDEAMTENVRTNLSLQDAVGKTLSGRRMAYLVRVAEEETREALEPFGHYSPTIVIQRSDRGSPEGGSADAARPVDTGATPDPERPVSVTITVQAGEPVKVRNETVAIEGDGGDDRYLAEEIEAFLPQPGSTFDHVQYEASKSRITRRLAERGYFDADFLAHRVEVTRAERAADIDLRWNSGDRYDMGAITFTQAPKQVVRPQLLDKLVYWNEGEYYHQGRLDRLRESLLKLDYFSSIDIEPRPDAAERVTESDGETSRRVPVTVTLAPAKRDIYTAGVSYGTDSGAGVRFGLERRYVNQRGHKALGQVDYAQNRKTATLQYRVPAFAWLDGWYTGSLQFADEQTDYIDTRRLELVGSRSGQFNRQLNLVASLHALRERWAYDFDGEDGDDDAPRLYRYANYFFPALRAEYTDVDDRFAPRRGIGGNLLVRGGSGQTDESDANALFAQAHVRASWFKGLGPTDRLIVRGELGHTFTDALNDLPPSLRFYAGGDRSIRGYNWREVGPRILDDDGDVAFALGAKNVVTASVEYERYFAGPWGGAVFVDTGDAFDSGSPELHTGVGIGVRWKSPVGPIRIDIARGLKDPDSPFTLHLNIGTDL